MKIFLGSLNYVSNYFQGLRKICRPLYKRLEKNPPAWTDKHTMIVRQIKKYVKQLPCIVIPSPHAFKIVETDACDIGYGGILKRVAKDDAKEKIVRFHSGYLRVLVNSDLLLMNSDMSSLSILRAFCLNWHICLSINLYPRNYHNLANQSYSHTAHAHELLHNYYIEHHMKWEDE